MASWNSLREGEQEQSNLGTDDPCSFSRSEARHLALRPVPGVPSPTGPGHVTADGNRPASSGPGPHVDVEDLRRELDLIDRKLSAGMVVDSENARSTRAILVRQKREIEAKLA
jgi:hypothetical protein